MLVIRYILLSKLTKRSKQTNGSSQWQTETQSILKRMSIFWTPSDNTTASSGGGKDTFQSRILREMACEPQDSCSNNEQLFKGLTAQWMGASEQLADFVIETTSPVLQASALGAVEQCNAGKNKTLCRFSWEGSGKNDGQSGLEVELSALNAVLANLYASNPPPASEYGSPGKPSGTKSGTPSPSPSASSVHTGAASSRLGVAWSVVVACFGVVATTALVLHV